MADLIINVSLGAATSLTAGPEVMGAAVGLSVLWVSAIVSYGLLFLMSVENKDSATESTLFGATAMSLTTSAVTNFLSSQSDGAQRAFKSFLAGLQFGVILLIGAAIVTGISLFFYYQHPTVMASWGEIRQCIVRPIVDKFIYPILNVVRLLYSTIWPLVNAGRRISKFIMSGYRKLLLACAGVNFSTLLSAFTNAKDAIVSAIFAVALYLGGGLFRGERINTLPVFMNVGAVVNYTLPILDCFCSVLQPIWHLAASIPQLPSLHVTGECAVATASRLPQLIFDPVIQGRLPSISNLTTELLCTLFSATNFIEDVVVIIVEFFYGILLYVNDLLNPTDAAIEAVGLRSSRLYASAAKLRVPPEVIDHLNLLPLRTLGATWHLVGRSTVTIGAASVLDYWNIFDALDLYITLGMEALLRVLSIPWTRVVTEPVALVLNIVNQTVEVVLHPVQAFGAASGVRYFQIGHLGDRLRVVADTFAQVLVLFDRALPCSVSMPLQVAVSVPEMILELIRELFYATVFPPYKPGRADECGDLYPCAYPAPSNWSFFDVFPAYYDWEDNRVKQSLNLLLEGGECTAFLLGCNTSAINNNSTNITSNCSSAPVACLARSTNKIIVKILNGTLTFLYYVPDYFRFSADYHTFRDIPFEGIEEAVSEWVNCLSNWLDTLDENEEMCLTTTPPPDRPQPNPNATIPADPPSDGVEGTPARAAYECRIDGRAYYLDGRVVVLRYTDETSGISTDADMPCNMTDSRQCAIATGTYGQILGSAPESNTTIVISPYPGASRFAVTVNATAGTATYGNYTPYGIDTVTVEDCTASLPLPDPLPEEFACNHELGEAAGITMYNSQNVAYHSMDLLVNGIPPTLACDYEPDPRIQCISNLAYLNGVYNISFRALNADPEADFQLTCSDGPVVLSGVYCHLNRLIVLVDAVPDTTTDLNISLTYPVFYRLPGVSTQHPVPCELEAPAGYTCDAGLGEVMAISGDPVIAVKEDASTDQILCRPNHQLTAPTCTRVILNYTDGASAVAELEGGEVRLYVNDTRFTTTCLYGSLAAATTSTLFEQKLAQSSILDTFRAAKAKVLSEARRPRDEAPEPVFTVSHWRTTAAGLSPGYYTRADAHFHTSDDPLYRKESFLCCLSETIRSLGQFLVAFFFEWIYTFRALLALPAFPTEGFDVPTFEEARDELRTALCQLACTVTQIIPVTFSCPGLENSAGCGTGASCARNMICDLLDVPLLIADILVDILRTIKGITEGSSSSDVLGDSCLNGDYGSCFVNFLVYVITKVLFTITLVFRGIAGFLDCILCALIRIGDNNFTCVPVIYAFIDALADLVDGIGAQLLTSVLNFIVGIIEVVIYFFSGQFGKLVDALFVKVFGAIGDFFTRLGDLLLQFFLQLPVVGDILRVIFDIIEGACDVLNDIITTFGGADLNCPDLDSRKKRDIAATGWMTLWSNATLPWQSGQPMHGPCFDRMNALNATDLTVLTVAERQEFMYCSAAHLWLLDNTSDATFTSSCDILMREAYTAGTAWSALGLSKGSVVECLEGRLKMESIRAKDGHAYNWAPHDFLYNAKNRWPQLALDVWLAYDVWNQYAEDRNTPANVLVSSAYRAQWASKGFSVAHLDALASTAVTASDVYTALDANAGAFSLTAYATRAAAAPPRISRQLMKRQYDAARVAGIADTFWRRTMNGTETTPSVFGHVIQSEWARMAAQVELASLSVPFTAATLPAMTMANDTRLLSLSIGGLVNVFAKDIPAMVAYLTKDRNTTSPLKRTLETGFTLPYYLLRAGYGGILLAKEWLSGKAMQNALWLSDPATQDWLHAHANNTIAMGGVLHATNSSSALHYVANRVYKAVTAIIPKAEPMRQMAALFARASEVTTSTAFARRSSISALFGRSMLSVAAALEKPAYEVRKGLKAAIVDPGTGIECLLVIENGTETIAPLCETGACLYLDQLLGTIVDSFTDLFTYYAFQSERCRLYPTARGCRILPNSTTLPTLARSMARYNTFSNYTFDDDAAVQIGPYASYGVTYPWRDHPELDILEDTDVGKIGFSDLAALWNATVFFFQQSIGVQFGSIGIASSSKAGYSNVSYSHTAGKPFGRNAATISMDFFQRATEWYLGPATNTTLSSAAATEFATLFDVLLAWYDFFYSGILKCSVTTEVDGSMKRVAIGIGVGIMFIASVVIAVVLYALGISSFVMMFVNIGGIFAVLTLAGTLIVTYSWSYRCTPALPVSLADDLFALLVYTVFPKCSTSGGLCDQTTYTNLTCYACSGWQNGTWTFPSFTQSLQNGGRFGFEDLSFNIIFTLKHYFPSLLASIRSTGPRIPFIGSLFNIDIVQARLGAYDFYNRTALTEKAHAQFVGGNWITTLINLGVLALILAAAYVLSDLIGYLIGLIRALLQLVAKNVIVSLVALWAVGNMMFVGGGFPAPAPLPSSSPNKVVESKRMVQYVEMVDLMSYSPL